MTAPALRQWDVVKVRINPQDRDEHPAVVISPDEIAGNPDVPKVNVLYGTTRRGTSPEKPGQVVLGEADGCEHLTVFDCIFFPVVRKDQVRVLGHVSKARLRTVQHTIAAALRLFQ